jgi:hypothetical protein
LISNAGMDDEDDAPSYSGAGRRVQIGNTAGGVR